MRPDAGFEARLKSDPRWHPRLETSAENPVRPRVLIVDDDAGILNYVRILLASDFEVRTAAGGEVALEVAPAFDPELVVLDLRMPGMDGAEVYQELRSRGITAKVLILSAYGAEKARAELGAEAALPKPFDPDILIAELRRLHEGK